MKVMVYQHSSWKCLRFFQVRKASWLYAYTLYLQVQPFWFNLSKFHARQSLEKLNLGRMKLNTAMKKAQADLIMNTWDVLL